MKEIFKDIQGYEGLYKISNMGRVKTLSKKFPNIIFLKSTKNNRYPNVSLSKNNKSSSKLISRLVAQTFIPNPNNFETVNHKDKNKNNNRVNNLEWLSIKDNIRYSIEEHQGENNGQHKLTEKQVIEIKKIKESNPQITIRYISTLFNVTEQNIGLICRNKAWKHIL